MSHIDPSAAIRFCNMCVPLAYDEEDGDGCEDARDKLCFLFVYPSYEYDPPENSTAEQQTTERFVHNYMVRLGRFPKPLPPRMCHDHCQIITDTINTNVILRPGFSTLQGIEKDVKSAAAHSKVLLLHLCGHGNSDGSFVASDGRPVGQHELVKWLQEAKFDGTVICVFNSCNSEACGGAPNVQSSIGGWNASLPFRWIHMYSCGGDETQVPSHALHVARLLSLLIKTTPPYTELQEQMDRLWVTSSQPADRWRAPPTLSMGRPYAGIFLGAAS